MKKYSTIWLYNSYISKNNELFDVSSNILSEEVHYIYF